MNNRRQFVKKLSLFGLLVSFTPFLAKSKGRFSEGGYITWHVGPTPPKKYSYIFDECKTYNFLGHKYWKLWDVKENKIIFSSDDNWKTLLFYDEAQKGLYKWRTVKNFTFDFFPKFVYTIEDLNKTDPIDMTEVRQLKIKIEFEIA